MLWTPIDEITQSIHFTRFLLVFVLLCLNRECAHARVRVRVCVCVCVCVAVCVAVCVWAFLLIRIFADMQNIITSLRRSHGDLKNPVCVFVCVCVCEHRCVWV